MSFVMKTISSMADDRVDIKRTRGHSEAGSLSGGSHGRRRFPEKLVDAARRVGRVGRASVDNGAAVSADLANSVQLKACQLEIRLENRKTGDLSDPCWGQAGLIQAGRLTDSPIEQSSSKKKAVADLSGKPVARPSILRTSRFAVIPVTCIHNVESETSDDGHKWDYSYSVLKLVSQGNANTVPLFDKAGNVADGNTPVVVRQGTALDETITWPYYDVTTAPKIDNKQSNLTLKSAGFQKVERPGYRFQPGQKIGMAVYRNFELNCEDAGVPDNSIPKEELLQIYGQKGRVNVYTGQITKVSPDGSAFEHDINTFRGCSGAIVFLLDTDQDGDAIESSDYGKAIAIHVGGDELDGKIINIAFKIP